MLRTEPWCTCTVHIPTNIRKYQSGLFNHITLLLLPIFDYWRHCWVWIFKYSILTIDYWLCPKLCCMLQLGICYISPYNQIIKTNNQMMKMNNQIFRTTMHESIQGWHASAVMSLLVIWKWIIRKLYLYFWCRVSSLGWKLQLLSTRRTLKGQDIANSKKAHLWHTSWCRAMRTKQRTCQWAGYWTFQWAVYWTSQLACWWTLKRALKWTEQ